VPTSTIHKILRNRIYTGDFDFGGVTYNGGYEPIVSRELWEAVQAVLSGRGNKKTRAAKHQFAFSGMVTCAHCGCAVVGELKKGRYTYYHCTGHKGKCPEAYTRQEILEAEFVNVIRSITFSDDVLRWAESVMHASHFEEVQQHAEAIARLTRESQRIDARLDVMYVDKLDGRIDNAMFDRMAAEFRAQKARIAQDIATHEADMARFTEQRARVADLARRAADLFEAQPAAEKRKLLRFVVAGCRWGNGRLEVEYLKPFAMMARSANPSVVTVLPTSA
jgi:hypothetical protein